MHCVNLSLTLTSMLTLIHLCPSPTQSSRLLLSITDLLCSDSISSLNELCLVFPDGPSDVRPDKQSVVAREDSEHLIGTLGSAQLVS